MTHQNHVSKSKTLLTKIFRSFRSRTLLFSMIIGLDNTGKVYHKLLIYFQDAYPF